MDHDNDKRLPPDDKHVLDALAEANRLYEEYLKLTRYASLPPYYTGNIWPHEPRAPLWLVVKL